MDWSIEVSKDFIFICYFKLKNAVRPTVRCVCMIDCNSGGHVTRRVFSHSSMFSSVSFGYYCFSYFDYKSLSRK